MKFNVAKFLSPTCVPFEVHNTKPPCFRHTRYCTYAKLLFKEMMWRGVGSLLLMKNGELVIFPYYIHERLYQDLSLASYITDSIISVLE